MNKFTHHIVIGVILLLLGSVADGAVIRATVNKTFKNNVLYISSYSPIKEKGTQTIESFVNTLSEENKENKENIKVSVEYMDCGSSSDFEHWTNWMKQLSIAYKSTPSAIVIYGSEAWSAYRAAHIERWRNVPIILGGIRNRTMKFENVAKGVATLNNMQLVEHTFGEYKVTGYYYQDYVLKNLHMMKKMLPNITKVAFCYDNRYAQTVLLNYLTNIFKNIDNFDLTLLDGSKISTAQLLDSLSALDDSYAVLMIGWYTDCNNYPYSNTLFNNELRRHTSKPVFQFSDLDFLNMNYMGGYFVSGKELGADLALLTNNVLKKGIDKAPAFGLTPSPPSYHINYPTFKEAGISEKLLPEDVIFYNQEETLWTKHPVEVVLACLLLLVIFALFIVAIHYRKRKEEIYRTEYERMMQLLGTMPDMVVIFDSKLKVIELINPQQAVLLGFSRNDLIEKDIDALGNKTSIFQTAFKLVKKNVEHTFRTNETQMFEYEVVNEKGSHFAKARTVPFSKDQVICFVHDITTNVVSEQEVLKWKMFFQSIVDNLPVGLFVKDVSNDYRYMFYNEKAGSFYDNINFFVVGKNDYELHHPLSALYRYEDDLVLKSAEPLSFERILFDQQTGHPYRWAITTKNRLINSDGTCYIVSVLVDTTEMRKKELELENTRKELSLALEVGRIIPWELNIKTQNISSPNVDEFEFDHVSTDLYMQCVHPDDRATLRKALDSLIDNTSEALNLQMRACFKGTEMKWYELHGQVIERTETGRVVRIIGVRRDITDLKITDELIELRNKAEESNRLKSAFLANMSHEIRTPLNAIVGFSNLLTQTEDPEEVCEFCQIIETNNDLLLQLINDILDLSKIEAEQLEFVYSEVDIPTLVRNLEQVYKSKVKEGVALQCELPKELATLYTDKNRITQVLSNFLGNACKFTSEGKIRLSCNYEDEKIRFYVEDTGIGIDPKNLPHVFKRFAKFDSFVQGTGLGLSISESIIQHLGGEIGVQSTLGKGSLFWFTLPKEAHKK